MQKTPDPSTPRWSPDRMWWWDGVRWVLANPAPPAAPPTALPPPPPAAYSYMPPSYAYPPPGVGTEAPSGGMRVFLIVMLAIAALLSGLMSVAGTFGVTGGDTGTVSISLWLLFIALFVLSAGGLVGVLRRSTWGRGIALAAGIGVTLTCLGAVIGIPIIYLAARAPLGKPARVS